MTDFLKWARANWVSIVGFLIALELQITSGTMSFEHSFPAAWIPIIKEWAANLASVGGLMVGAGTLNRMPQIPPAVKSAIMFALVTGWLLFGFAGHAHAQDQTAPAQNASTPKPTKACPLPWDPLKLCGALTGNPATDIQRVAQRLAKVGHTDLIYAMAKAKAANTNAGNVRLQCLTAISAAADSAKGTGLKDAQGNALTAPPTGADLITSVEELAELVDALSPQGALLTSCIGAAGLFKTNALGAVNGLVTGATSLAAAGAAGL